MASFRVRTVSFREGIPIYLVLEDDRVLSFWGNLGLFSGGKLAVRFRGLVILWSGSVFFVQKRLPGYKQVSI